MEGVAVRLAVSAAEDAAGAMAHAFAGGVADCRLRGLYDHLDDAAGAAAVLAGAAGIRAELVRLEKQRETRLGHFEAAELDAASRVPFAGAGPAVAVRRGPAARTALEEMPKERPLRPRVLALDRDAEAAAPAGHRALRAGRRQRLDDRLDDLLAAMARAQGQWQALVGPDDRSGFGGQFD